MMLTANPNNTKARSIPRPPFSQLNAFKKLQELAKHPYDLTFEGNLSVERLENYYAEGGGYKLLYATERVDEATLEALHDLALETDALEQMAQMQSGEIVNLIEGCPSENRQALHTATRDFFAHPQSSKKAKQATSIAKIEVDKLERFIKKINEENCWESILLVGIGGSELGPKAHYEALASYMHKGRSAHFLSNIDPDAIEQALQGLDLSKTLVLVISKTGTTLETVTNEQILRDYFQESKLNPLKHFISITCQHSPLDDHKKYREVFYIWDWIGGRYSTTSMVGGVLLAFAFGFDVFWQLLEGANAMDKVALSREISQNPPLMAALLGIWNRNFLNHPVLAIIPYSEPLKRFPAHIQQLDMESNGKHIDKQGNIVNFATGPIIFGEPGTSSQHSFYQLLHQGTTIVPIEFIAYKNPQSSKNPKVENTTSQQKLLANVIAQAIALATGQKEDNPNKCFQGNRPTHLICGNELTPFALGALLSFYEHKVAFQGFMWGINSFDQEGVQLGKILANKILDRFIEKGPPYPQGDAFMKLIEQESKRSCVR